MARKIRSGSATPRTAGALKRKKAAPVRLLRGPVYRSSGNAMYLYRIIGGDRANITVQALELADRSPAYHAPSTISRARAKELFTLAQKENPRVR